MRQRGGSAEKRKESAGCALLKELNKPIDGFAVVGFSGLYDGLRPVGMVETVGVELGFQGHTGTLTVIDTVLALFIQVIACVNLNTGTVGVHFHGSSGNGIRQHGAGVAENLPVVVEATLQVQRLVIHTNISADGLGTAEIHGGALYTAQFTGGNILGIIGVKEPAGNHQNLIHGGIRLFVTGQIEVAVIVMLKTVSWSQTAS